MDSTSKHPLITWFASNSVVANIMMISILAWGVFTLVKMRKEAFPSFDAESVTVSVPFRGGTPEDVERGVAIKIEEALVDVKGIEHITSVSTESSARITTVSYTHLTLPTILLV